MLWPWKMPIVAFRGGRGYRCRLETSVPRVGILKPKQEVRGKGGTGGCAKSKARSCSLKVARALSLSRPQATRTLSLVASQLPLFLSPSLSLPLSSPCSCPSPSPPSCPSLTLDSLSLAASPLPSPSLSLCHIAPHPLTPPRSHPPPVMCL